MLITVSSSVRQQKRILLRSGKNPYDVLSVEEALHRDVIATNSGNLVFQEAAHKILEVPGTEVVSGGVRTDLAAAARVNEEYDAFVVPLANAFRPSFEAALTRLTRFISRLRIPVVVLGVGAQTGVGYDPARLKRMEPAVRDFCAAVLERSASIGVRGEFTERYLKDMGFNDVEVIGCPSLFLHGPDLDVRKRVPELTPDSRISVNGSHGAIRSQGFDKILDRTRSRYPNLRFVGQNLSDARQLHWRDLTDPNARLTSMPTHPEHPMYRADQVRVYVDPRTWIEDLRRFDFSFGSRIHGNIAALLAGTPATVLCGDSRTLELCRYFEIPHRRLDQAAKDPASADPALLYAQADFGALVGNHGERFARFTGFMERNGLRNTFTHGDGGAAFEKRMRSLPFPPGVRPWNDSDPASLSGRFSWLHTQVSELTQDNAELRKELARAKKAQSAAAAPSVYRRARRAVGRPLKRALQSGRQQQ
ncbi:polysaccharide pyruvyl transferase family protein [Streptomyces misionensis]|uniref:polysaccharide pyruvyl transferase family protein n=1 Tax=Streptomyces misionensis TaxID=67331 RepID=UPI003F4D6423